MIQTIKVDGKDIKVKEIDFETVKDEWDEYKLLDGGTVRVKTVIRSIFYLVDDKGNSLLDPDGNPQVSTRSSTQVVYKR